MMKIIQYGVINYRGLLKRYASKLLFNSFDFYDNELFQPNSHVNWKSQGEIRQKKPDNPTDCQAFQNLIFQGF
jgi:hypothetical protein